MKAQVNNGREKEGIRDFVNESSFVNNGREKEGNRQIRNFTLVTDLIRD